ncbi:MULTISPECIES: hypothetical protein [Glaesserella]|uniref:Pilus assembly protein PilP n=1 Tax=Glaesserella australis TaxID=2094024 RepID=A0A328BYD6_9PAST|nr:MULTISPECIES: hypothetical protein [Glaesserella]AUI66181.1 hypothetical protein CJD39_06125 [Glaesserella sp. 15-184]RAL19203.1 hypothetical protein C5N92_03550 [Glaesserella australis]
MLKPIFLITLYFSSIFTYADPFYKDEEQAVISEEKVAKNAEKLPTCLPNSLVNKINMETTFDKLTLVGILQIDEKIRAIFIDGKKRIIDLFPDDYLTKDNIQIKEMDFKSVRYIAWDKVTECQAPKLFTLKF